MTFKEARSYWNLKEKALHGTLKRSYFGRGYGPVVRVSISIIIIIMPAYDTVRHERDSPRFDHIVCVHMKCLYSRRYFTGY